MINQDHKSDVDWMRLALKQAHAAAEHEEVPVGAIVVINNELVASAFNRPISANDSTAHAEIIALRAACDKLGNYRLPGASLYVTLEPCCMCAGALIHARIERLIFGAYEPKAGVISSHMQMFDKDFFNHRVQWQGGVLEEECGKVLSDFFKGRR